ncbi:serine/threonine protein kinase [Antrihabitans sp. YC3-6]|uniref:non-specific serine/threonine protein kinase n=1 Tax=Antrihabitans stalagmiti TaxID=2799499 RepID=A0A934NRW0_9NOCA|nr:serine/threonine-protein kinase [Antrihabitans stalagmiti]MBJ8340193.1 serine/threonine protein kinase [Antrihabitans stalagmiti]
MTQAEHTVVPPYVADRFTAEWESTGRPPDFDAYLPDAEAIRRVALIDLIRIDLEHRWLHARLPKRLTDYCVDYPELRADRLPATLIYEEVQLRRRSGDVVDELSYLREYPAQARQLAAMLDAAEDTRTVAARTEVGTDAVTNAVRVPDALEYVEVGQRVDEFDLLTGLGSGAFARVFLARQRSMQRLVAVKISEDHGTEPQTLAQLDHDYIVRVFDQRVVSDRGLKLLYMQYVPGGTLLGVLHRIRQTPAELRSGQLLLDVIDSVLVDRGEIRPADSTARDELATLTWPETVAWLGRRLAEALDYAHNHLVLHRDIKPANVLLTAEGIPKLADFNISYNRNVDGASPIAYFGGSLSYMSPEQLEACHPDNPSTAAELDTRSDIYSLGVVLWELLTGRKPFPDNRIAAENTPGRALPGDRTTLDALLLHRRSGVSDEMLADLPANTPATLRRVLLRCLAPERDDRWATGAELAQQLDLCLDARARDLVDPPPGSWRFKLRPWSILIMELGVVVPNALAAYLNYFIVSALVAGKLDEAAQHRFDVIWFVVTVVSFPIGALLILYMRRYLVLVPHGLKHGKTYPPDILARARSDALLLGDRVTAILFGVWISFGIGWAVTMAIVIGDLSQRDYVYFFASIVVCAAIAVSYPYFLVAFYAVRCLYPTFLPHGEVSGKDSTVMVGLHRRGIRYLALSAAVPLVAVAGATFVPLDEIGSVIVAVRILCIGGVIAFIGVYWLFRKVEADLNALEGVTSNTSEQIP